MPNNCSPTLFIFNLLLSLCIGSFLNACITRIPKGISIVIDRSHCDHCKTQLGPLDLIPLFSFFISRGKCQHCKAPISWQNPLVEILTAIGLSFLFCQWGFQLNYFFYGTFYAILLLITFIDLNHQIIPDSLLAIGFGVAVTYRLFHHTLFWNGLMGGIFAYSLLSLIAKIGSLIYRQPAMGEGDPLLAGVIGLFLGWPLASVSLYFAFIIGAAWSLPLLLLQKKGRLDLLPFGPALVVGGILAWLMGRAFLIWLQVL